MQLHRGIYTDQALFTLGELKTYLQLSFPDAGAEYDGENALLLRIADSVIADIEKNASLSVRGGEYSLSFDEVLTGSLNVAVNDFKELIDLEIEGVAIGTGDISATNLYEYMRVDLRAHIGARRVVLKFETKNTTDGGLLLIAQKAISDAYTLRGNTTVDGESIKEASRGYAMQLEPYVNYQDTGFIW
jgi:hypothetical protein